MNDQYSKYLKFFRGNQEHISQQGSSYYYPIKRSLDEYYLKRHFNGDATFGLYLLTKENNCHLLCIDIDIEKRALNDIDFKNSKAKFEHLSEQLNTVLKVLMSDFDFKDNHVLLEETGGRGYHIWLFLSEPIPGDTAISFGSVLKSFLDFDIEFFPKQGRLTKKRKYGNLIKLPLGIHQKYGARSTFFKLKSDGPVFNDSLHDNMAHLGCIDKIEPGLIKKIIHKNIDAISVDDNAIVPEDYFKNDRVFYKSNQDFHTSKCNALARIWGKAKNGEELSHSEAFHFANVMLSVTDQKQIIHDLIKSTYGATYSLTKTEAEISKIMPLNPSSCKTLYQQSICPAYCKPSIKKRIEDPLAPNTSPCSVWLKRENVNISIDRKDLGRKVGSIDSVKRAYFRLRQYHEHEDSLFFDPFDFELEKLRSYRTV